MTIEHNKEPRGKTQLTSQNNKEILFAFTATSITIYEYFFAGRKPSSFP